MSADTALPFLVQSAPGHLIRRAQQLAVAQFNIACAAHDLTPVQFGVLAVLSQEAGIDQLRLAQRLALDAATTGSVIKRLESKAYLLRTVNAKDKRSKHLHISDTGRAALGRVTPLANDAQHSILSALDVQEQQDFMRLLSKLVAGFEQNAQSTSLKSSPQD